MYICFQVSTCSEHILMCIMRMCNCNGVVLVRRTCCAYSSKGDLLVSASSDCTVRVWNPLDGTNYETIEEHDSDVTAVAINGSGTHLVSVCSDGTFKCWPNA